MKFKIQAISIVDYFIGNKCSLHRVSEQYGKLCQDLMTGHQYLYQKQWKHV
jgi:hypothetical protein